PPPHNLASARRGRRRPGERAAAWSSGRETAWPPASVRASQGLRPRAFGHLALARSLRTSRYHHRAAPNARR
ncbi:hypothetical protein, partial [Novosphingobium pentaromativorans]|uniref:hypothetical protein n=1 Tax=Novosphingobium pentaromativorans TaxID=205844 RepID=UPI001EE63C48